MSVLLEALVSAAGVSLISLIGVAALPFGEKGLQRITFVLISLAVGALFGDTVLHIFPEVFKDPSYTFESSCAILFGIFISFVFEKFLRWKDHQDMEHATH